LPDGAAAVAVGESQAVLNTRDVLDAWKRVLTGSVPLLSIEITRECPLHCPGCYAYGDTHLGGGTNLRQLSDYRGDELVQRIVGIVDRHRPLHISLVGGEPLVRHRELSKLLPILSDKGVWSMVVTSAVIPIPEHWQTIPRTTVAVSVDGLPEHHDIRRHPATYERILQNIAGRRINLHLTITAPMLTRPDYLDEYFTFWSARPEVEWIWVSTYTPQVGENTPEMLTAAQREQVARATVGWRGLYRKLLMDVRTPQAFANPPTSPDECAFAKLSVNYSADLKTRVEPCIFGGTPDCSKCGCAISIGLHGIQKFKVGGFVPVGTLVQASTAVGAAVNWLRPEIDKPQRWGGNGKAGKAA
jgi:MoaA/NifB/PqqE/SkfB family radical SAM enzyme